jgi:hypothetical protein
LNDEFLSDEFSEVAFDGFSFLLGHTPGLVDDHVSLRIARSSIDHFVSDSHEPDRVLA